MKKVQSSFALEAEKIRIQPPRSAWKRIEAQLDAEGSRRKFRIAHLINYAAAVVLIAVFSLVGLYLYTASSSNDSRLYSLRLESLSTDYANESSIYNIEKVKDLTAYYVSAD